MSAEARHGPLRFPYRVEIVPRTSLGRWAVVLAAVFLPLVLAAGVVPRAAALGLICGIAGGVAASAAIFRQGERAITVFAAVTPMLIAVSFLIAELIGGTP